MKPLKPSIPTPPLVHLPDEARKVAESIGVATPPKFNAFDEVQGKYTALGANNSSLKAFGTDPAVARSRISSAAMTMAGVTRDLEALGQGVTAERLEKLVRSLNHAVNEMGQLRDSRDVQLERYVAQEVGVNFFKADLFDETNKLHHAYVGLLESLADALPRIEAHAARAAATVKELFGEVARILSEPSVLESHLMWHPVPEGDNITRISAVFPGTTTETEAAGVKAGFLAHIDAENKLAKADLPGAIADFHRSASEVFTSTGASTNTAFALTYLADALLMTGLDKTPVQVAGKFTKLDAEALYRMALRTLRASVKEADHPELRRLVEHVHTQLFDADHPDAAMKLTHEALGPTVPSFGVGLIRATLFPSDGPHFD